MTANPVSLIGGMTNTANVPKADIVGWAKARIRQRVADVTELRNTDFSGQVGGVYVATLGAIFDLNPTDTTSADDGSIVIIDLIGNRFTRVIVEASSFTSVFIAPVYDAVNNPFPKCLTITSTASGNAPQGSNLIDGWSANEITLNDLGVNSGRFAAGAQTTNAFHVHYHGSGTKSIGQAILGTVLIDGVPAQADNDLNQFVAGQFIALISASLGGTNTGAGAVGGGFGLGASVVAAAGATNLLNVSNELDAAIAAGASSSRFSVLSLALHSLHQVPGTIYDAILSIGSAASIGAAHGILFSTNYNGHTAPVATTGTIIGASTLAGDAATVANFADFSNYTFTDYLLKFPNFTVNHLGAIAANSASTFTDTSCPLTLVNSTTGLALRALTNVSGVNPLVNFYVNAKPSVNDQLGELLWNAQDSSGVGIEYAFIDVIGLNVTAGTAAGQMRLGLAVNNVPTVCATLDTTSLIVGASKFTVALSSGNTTVAGTLGVTGALTAASVNKLTITTPATSATLTIADGKTHVVSNSLTFTGTDGNSFAFPSGSDTVVTRDASQTLTSKTLTSPTINGGTHTAITSLGIRSTGAAFDLMLASSEVLTAGRTLTITLNNAARTVNLGGNLTTAAAFVTSGANSLTLTTTGPTTVTLPTSGTLVNSAVAALSSLASIGTITTGVWNAGAIISSGNIQATGATSLMSVAPTAVDAEFYLKAASNVYNSTFWFQQNAVYPWRLRSDTALNFSLVDATAGVTVFTIANNTSDALHVNAAGGLSINTTSNPGAGLIYINSASFLMRNKTSWTNGAASSAGTLTNAPAVGNPTKWIPVDDNGTTRYIPAW